MDVFVVGGIGLALLVMALVFLTAQRERDFNDRFPPISDDEFVALCSPGTSRLVALTVRRIVAGPLALDFEPVHPPVRVIGDIGADQRVAARVCSGSCIDTTRRSTSMAKAGGGGYPGRWQRWRVEGT